MREKEKEKNTQITVPKAFQLFGLSLRGRPPLEKMKIALFPARKKGNFRSPFFRPGKRKKGILKAAGLSSKKKKRLSTPFFCSEFPYFEGAFSNHDKGGLSPEKKRGATPFFATNSLFFFFQS
jgi:hypothetical protein